MPLDSRKQALLQAIVVHYVDRAEPVGSSFLAAQTELNVRSATIRHELAEMTDLGYLRQPHTSAGRIPSDLGYRFYVDHLMRRRPLSAPHARRIHRAGASAAEGVEELLSETCRVLTGLTRYTSVASPPSEDDAVVRQIHLSRISPTRLLVVLVVNSGQVLHRFHQIDETWTDSQIERLGGRLSELLVGEPARSAAEMTSSPRDTATWGDLLDQLLQLVARGVQAESEQIFVEGASRVLDQPEFREAERAEPVVRFLEERKTALEMLRALASSGEMAISIGHENPTELLSDASLVLARYRAGSRSTGWVGLLGPTRMNYASASAAVKCAAESLSGNLSRLGLD